METGHNKNVTNFETLIIACTGYGARCPKCPYL